MVSSFITSFTSLSLIFPFVFVFFFLTLPMMFNGAESYKNLSPSAGSRNGGRFVVVYAGNKDGSRLRDIYDGLRGVLKTP